MSKFIYFDTETTSKSEDAEMIQFAMYSDHEGMYEQKYSINGNIEFGAMAVHHITPPMLEGMPSVEASGLRKMIKELVAQGYIFVAHNADFDVNVLRRYKITIPKNQIIDSLRVVAAADISEHFSEYNLQYLRYACGHWDMNASAHDALGDVMVLKQVFEHDLFPMARNVLEKSRGEFANITEKQIVDWMVSVSMLPQVMRRIPFGKYKGDRFEDLPESYLRWLMNNEDMDQAVKLAAKSALNY
jgi:exodeoxyribonuclease X